MAGGATTSDSFITSLESERPSGPAKREVVKNSARELYWSAAKRFVTGLGLLLVSRVKNKNWKQRRGKQVQTGICQHFSICVSPRLATISYREQQLLLHFCLSNLTNVPCLFNFSRSNSRKGILGNIVPI